MGLASAAAWRPREPDADTLRCRSLYDARGRVERTGTTYKGNGEILEWEIRRSLRGRHDQLDVVTDGRLLFTGGPRRIREEYGIKPCLPSPAPPTNLAQQCTLQG